MQAKNISNLSALPVKTALNGYSHVLLRRGKFQ